MSTIVIDHTGNMVGDEIRPSELGGEYLGWTGLPGWEVQAQHLGITHVRWPAGINAEDRIEANGYAFDISTPTIVDNWPLWNGNPRPGLSEMFATANEFGASFAMIVPSARYVELMRTDPVAAKAWIQSDITAFTDRLFNGEFGPIPDDFLLEIGAEYYSTDAWSAFADDPDIEDDFAAVFAEIVSALETAESAYGSDVFKIAVQAARFQSNDDTEAVQDGEVSDADAFIAAFLDAGVEDAIDALIWHRYLYMFNQTGHHLTPGVGEHTLEEHTALWEAALGSSLELVLGWAAPDVDRDGESLDSPFFDFGPRAAHATLQMFSELSEAGIDYATVYGMDSPWIGALTQGGVTRNDYSVSCHGEVYRLLADSVVGLTATDVFHGNAVVVDAQNGIVSSDHANVFGFTDGGTRDVAFIANWDLSSASVTLDVSIPEGFELGYVTIESIRPSDASTEAVAIPEILIPESIQYDHFDLRDTSDFMVTRLEFQHSIDGVPLPDQNQSLTNLETGRGVASLSNEANDMIWTETDFVLLGLAGNDTLRGSGSGSVLAGGVGSDEIYGSAGDDVIYGDDIEQEAMLSWLLALDDHLAL